MPDPARSPLGPEGLRVSIITAQRQPAYIHDTLASLIASDPSVAQLGSIDLMIDAPEASGYLRDLEAHPLFKLHYQSEEEWRVQKRRHVGHRFCHNYWRALHVALEDFWGLVVLEDDVALRDGFIARLILTVEEIRHHLRESCRGSKGLQQFMLALYSAYDFAPEPSFKRGRFFCSYGYPFFGTCGMFYDPSTVGVVRDYIHRFGVESHSIPGDLVLKQLAATGSPALYACTRDLVQHRGIVSSGLGAGAEVFSSPTFDWDWWPAEGSPTALKR